MRMVDFIKGLLDSILSGSLERMRIINAMNNSFKEAYYSGELEPSNMNISNSIK